MSLWLRYIFCIVIIQNFPSSLSQPGATIPPYRMEGGKSIGNSKIAHFSDLRVLCAPLKGFPFELGTDATGQKTRVMGLPGCQNSLMIPLSVSIKYPRVTNGQTDTFRRQRPRCVERRECKNEKRIKLELNLQLVFKYTSQKLMVQLHNLRGHYSNHHRDRSFSDSIPEMLTRCLLVYNVSGLQYPALSSLRHIA